MSTIVLQSSDHDISYIVKQAGLTTAEIDDILSGCVQYNVTTKALVVNSPNVDQASLDAAYASYVAQHDNFQLARDRELALQAIDEAAGRARARYITTAPGQELTYQEKAEEAIDYTTAGYPANLTNYPFIQAETDATGKTAMQAAVDILAKRSEWVMIGSSIERQRISGKLSVTNATTTVEIEAAKTDVILALDTI